MPEPDSGPLLYQACCSGHGAVSFIRTPIACKMTQSGLFNSELLRNLQRYDRLQTKLDVDKDNFSAMMVRTDIGHPPITRPKKQNTTSG